jgi:hypothetical protein
LLLVVVMNAVVVAEADSAKPALTVEGTRFAHMTMLDVGRKNCAIDPRITKPLVMSVICKMQRRSDQAC